MKKISCTLALCLFLLLSNSHAQWNLTGNSNATSTSLLGTTNSVPLRLATKNTPRIIIDTLGRVGIGITVPTTQLMVRGSGGNPAATWTNIGRPVFAGFGETNVGNADFILGLAGVSAGLNPAPRFAGRRSRGTLDVPSLVANGDLLMSFSAFGYDGTTFQNPSAIEFTVDSATASTVVPSAIVMGTGRNGLTRTERLRISSNGDVAINSNQLFVKKSNGFVGVGTNTPGGLFDVDGDALINSITIGRGGGNSNSNSVFGFNALKQNTTGYQNTAIGLYALTNNTTGFFNTAVGAQSLSVNTTGYFNTATGYQSLKSNSSGLYNTANGCYALSQNSTGLYNTAVGYNALSSSTTAQGNTAVGSNALANDTTGNGNTAVGNYCLHKNTIGSGNVAIGNAAMYANVSGSYNAAIGDNALNNNSSGIYNLAYGNSSLYTNTTGQYNIGIGAQSMYANNTGSYNTAVGIYSLNSNTIGNYNLGIGFNSLYSNTTGNFNTANGSFALQSNTKGSNNVAVGYYSLFYDSTGYSNVALGSEALFFNNSSNIVAIGDSSLYLNNGIGNTATGSKSLRNNALGNGNTANGFRALFTNYTGSFNTGLGYMANVYLNNLSNATTIGSSATVDSSNKAVIGNSSVSSIGGQVGWTSFSDGRIKQQVKENVPGLSFINLLKPVTYHFNLAKQYELLGREDTMNWKGKYDIEKINFTGFIAQDVEVAAKKIEYDFSGVDKRGKIMGLRYAEFVVPLVKAVQELSTENQQLQQANQQLSTTIDDLKVANAAMELRLSKLENALGKTTAPMIVKQKPKRY